MTRGAFVSAGAVKAVIGDARGANALIAAESLTVSVTE